MKAYVKIEPICPFVGKPCIRDGWEWGTKVAHPCMFWDESTYNGVNPEEPCRLKRMVNRILIREMPDQYDGETPDVPWDCENKE